MLGCYGHPIVQTPNLDALAASGTRFTTAMTPSPMCVPARAALATGLYPHQTGYWDSVFAYDGRVKGWGHHLQARGHNVTSIGKLHYLNGEADTGFTEQILPLHIVNGEGWTEGLLRKEPASYEYSANEFATQIGRGESSYTAYDRRITDATCDWLRNKSTAEEKPWVLFCSMVNPHYPLIAPDEFYDLYADLEIELPDPDLAFPDHPVLNRFIEYFEYRKHFTAESAREAIRSYYGLCSFLDDNIGKVLQTLRETGQYDDTVIIYTSDHGEHLGKRQMWTKMSMYEESAGVPMIIAGPNVPQSKVSNTAVNLVDCGPTFVEVAGAPAMDDGQLGTSLRDIASQADDLERIVLTEYHDGGSITGQFMLRNARWKYVHHVGYKAQLFDLVNDPDETEDLIDVTQHAEIVAHFEAHLHQLCDPVAINELCFAEQEAKVEEFGGREGILSRGTFGFTPISV